MFLSHDRDDVVASRHRASSGDFCIKYIRDQEIPG